MKKLLLSIVLLFSITIQSQEMTEKLKGIWSSEKTSYYVVITHDSIRGYEFINFSFTNPTKTVEKVIEVGVDYVKTKLTNKENKYKVQITYTVKEGKLHCEFEGDNNHETVYKRYWIMTN